jgi:hypothetical protein
MNVGMLWFDNDPRAALEAKVARAAAYYRNKYGSAPNLCFVHPTMLGVKEAVPAAPPAVEELAEAKRYVADGVEVRSNRTVLPNHLWIGINA